MSQDWTGNNKTAFVTLGASNHAKGERQQDDFYATDQKAAYLLMENESLDNVWECACGDGELAKIFNAAGILYRASDLIDRGYGETGIDFLKCKDVYNGDVVTNPPYKYAKEFVRKAYDLVTDGHKVCMFLKLTFLESQKRKQLFKDCPLKTLYVSSSRIACYKNNDRSYESSAIAYGWYVWEKGYKGEPCIKWIN